MNRASRRRQTGIPLFTMGRNWSSPRTSDRPKYWKRQASWDAESAWRSRGIRWRRAAWEWKGRWRWKLTTIFRMSRWCRWHTRMWVRAILQSIRQRCSSIASTRDWRTRRRSLMRCGRFKDRATTGKDDVQKLTRNSAQPNAMGGIVKDGYGGGIPVVAFWTSSVGEAIGHIETLPWTLSIPVKVEADGRVKAGVTIPVNTALKPGESYAGPRSFVAVYSGDYYEPLRMWSSVLQKEGWDIPKPSNEAYNVSWCGW